MRQVFVVKEKYRLAFYLTVIFTVCLLGSSCIQWNVAQADESLGSLYKDRLIPAHDIFEVQSRLYENQLLMQDMITTNQTGAARLLRKQMEGNDLVLDSLIKKVENTLLVKNESQALHTYRRQLEAYRQNYALMLRYSQQGANQDADRLYHQEGHTSFKALLRTVGQLASLQASVGQQVYQDSHHKLLGAALIAYLVLGVTIVLGLYTQLLLKTASLSARLPLNPHMN